MTGYFKISISRLAFALFAGALVSLVAASSGQAKSARKLFGAMAAPSRGSPQSYGFYSKGCISGASAMPVDGPHWQVMRLSRNRRFGHPRLISVLQQLSEKAAKGGWSGLMIGDMSQARGGPMLTGHASHQIGLDADIWFTPMPNYRLSYEEREEVSAVSILKKYSHYVSDRRWDKSYENLLKAAASFKDVERILVHPGIKKKLCDTVKGNRSWLNKIRPYYGHYYHFHVRLACQPGSPQCRKQRSTGTDIGCGKSLRWWFKSGLGSPKPKPKRATKNMAKRAGRKHDKQLSQLPNACARVLKKPAKSLQTVDLMTLDIPFSAPAIHIPALSVASIMKTKPIEANRVDHPVFVSNRATPPATSAQPNVQQAGEPGLVKDPQQLPTHAVQAMLSDPVTSDPIATGSIDAGQQLQVMERIPVPTPRPGK